MGELASVALVAAAGQGRRLGGGRNKVFLPLAGVPILAWTLHALRACEHIESIIVVTGAEDLDAARAVAHRCGVACEVVPGGATRARSVRAGLAVAATMEPTLVAVHDGARPFASPALIQRTLEGAARYGATGASLPVSDTIKIVTAEGVVEETPPRSRLRAMQTPQSFRRDLLIAAYEAAGDLADGMTDDCEVAERFGARVVLCEGERENLKITYDLDLVVAEAIAATREKPWYAAG